MARHTDPQLEEMSKHVTYEIERLRYVLPIQEQISAFVHPIITQSLLEAFLVHLRSLSDFMVVPITRGRHPLDVVAEDYYDGTWTSQPKFIFGKDEDEHFKSMDELHRRLAHISLHRASSPDPFTWKTAREVWQPALVFALRGFMAGLPQHRRPWFATAEMILNN
ncbi:hypothetical protein BH10ACT2_BH10ACT2_11400 [soil metagenome]